MIKAFQGKLSFLQIRYPHIKILASFFLLFILLTQFAPVFAQQPTDEYQNGWFAFQSKKYKKATEIWKKLAVKGDTRAALGLAAIYENGLGTDRDPVQSAHWYQVAADRGSPEAMHDLGIKYFTGNGVQKDRKKAFTLWKTAAEQGLGVAQSKVGFMYQQGIGTEKNLDQAVRWYRQGAMQNDPESMYNLALMYGSGIGVEKDEKQFLQWLQKAAEHKHARAQLDLGLMALYGRFVKQNIAFGETMLQRSAEGGFADAQYYLGTLYRSGQILAANEEKARYYLTMAAKQGHAKAKTELAEMDSLSKISPNLYRKNSAKRSVGSGMKNSGSSESHISRRTKKTVPVNTGSTKKSIRDSEWILHQNPNHYVAQLISFSSQEAAEKYAKGLDINDEIIIYQLNRNGKSFYNVVTGVYSDYDQAKTAIGRFPEKLKKLKPWIRKLNAVHQLIQ